MSRNKPSDQSDPTDQSDYQKELLPVLFHRLFFCWLCVAACAGAAEEIAIPLKPDPPFAIDGDLSDWRTVPGALELGTAEQVVWGKSAWSGPEDCSGTVQWAWWSEHLYVAASLRDDAVRQSQRGREIWRGDNVMLFLDVQPDRDPGRTAFGDEQFQIALSPGSFTQTGDPLRDVKPEAFCYQPEGHSLPGASVAATRTAEGYAVEAAIPWDALGLESPAEGTRLRVEVAISDTDSAPEQQESLLTSATATWEITRLRLQAAVLARADGAVAAREAEGAPVFDAVTLARGAAQSFTFSLPTPLPAREAVLRLQARMEFPQVGGYTPALHLTVNGTVLDAPRLLNKPQRAKARGGAIYSMAAGDRFSTYYTPDFDSPDTHSIYGLVDGYAACTFDLRVTDLLRPGDNTLEVTHRGDVENALIAANAQILFVETLPQAREKAGPPIAPLPRLTPKLVHETEFSLEELPDAGIIVSVGAARYKFQSRSSTPDGVWVHGSNAHFKHERRVEKTAEVVRVYDSFQNLTDAPLPLMHRHEVQLDAAPDQLWLAGLDQPSREGNVTSASNPTLCARFGHHGFGLLPLDDVFRIHGAVYAVPGLAGLADNQLVLAPGATYTAEWALIPLAENGADYWTFLNAARRLVGANFLIDGGFAFLRNGPLTDAWSDAELSDFLKFKDPKYVCASIDHPRYNGMYTHGTSFQRVAHDSYRASFARWRQLAPAVDCLVYFHCFIDVVEDGPQLFADARLLGPDGAQADYGEPYDRLYIPLENNSFGPAIARNVDIILDTIQAEGVYWDEHEYSRLLYHYGEPWDGFSGDIDADTMKLRGLKSSVTLLTNDWRVALAKKILARGPLIGNGPPFTRAMAALHFPCFVETGSITHCTQSHLYSPIALGDHLTERSELDAYKTMLAALDFGCVYHWYNDMTVLPTHPHLTSYMFPITPLELHEGYIIGEERIITNRSGLFGWGDISKHEVHVFDDTGREVPEFSAPEVLENGQGFTELRLAEEWSAAIVREKSE